MHAVQCNFRRMEQTSPKTPSAVSTMSLARPEWNREGSRCKQTIGLNELPDAPTVQFRRTTRLCLSASLPDAGFADGITLCQAADASALPLATLAGCYVETYCRVVGKDARADSRRAGPVERYQLVLMAIVRFVAIARDRHNAANSGSEL